MFYSLTGKLVHMEPSVAVIECGGVAFKCLTSMHTQRSLPRIGETATLYTHLNVREDALDLFGFSSKNELNCFKMLTGISGVGPKVALAILSELSPEGVAVAAASGDSKSFTRASGVGPKLGQRIVLELKDKFGKGTAEFSAGSLSASVPAVMGKGNRGEAVAALAALGYSQAEAASALSDCADTMSVEDMIRAGLKKLSRNL